MKKFVLILSLCSIGVFGQKTSNRNLTSPFTNTEYLSGAFSSIINKTEDTFQIVKDKDSNKYALIYKENHAIMSDLNNTNYDPNNIPVTNKSIIFDSKEQVLGLYEKIEKAIKDNIEISEYDVNGTVINISYTKIPLVPGSLSLEIGPKGEVSSSFGMAKNRWKAFFDEIK